MLSSELRKIGKNIQGKVRGETFPDVSVHIDTEGGFFSTNISIAWAGAKVDVVKRQLDEAVKVLKDISNSLMKYWPGGHAAPYSIDVNSTKYQGVVKVGFPMSWSLSEQGVEDLKAKAEELGLEVI